MSIDSESLQSTVTQAISASDIAERCGFSPLRSPWPEVSRDRKISNETAPLGDYLDETKTKYFNVLHDMFKHVNNFH